MKKQNIEDIFSSMEDFSSVPPPELWGQIEEKLDKPKKKKRAILWWSAAACLLLGLMLPTALYFNSTSGIKTIHNGTGETNSVVLDDNKDSNRTIAPKDQNSGQSKPEDSSNNTETNSSINHNTDPINSSQKNQKTAVAQSDDETKTNSDVLAPKSNIEKRNINHPVTEKNVASAKEKTSNSNQSDSFNPASKNQLLNADKKVTNQAVAEKTSNTGNSNGFNTDSKKQILNADKKAPNQAVAEKTYNTVNSNGFNTDSKNQVLNTNKKAANQVVAEKTYNISNSNGFNLNQKNQVLSADKKATNKILAEKTFNAGKTNAFNSNLKNQVSSSIFENQVSSKNNKSIASNTSNSFLNGNEKPINESTLKQKSENIILPSKELLASNQKNNSKFKDVLSKQDSVQLAELQNLEKGIITPEVKKENDNKKVSKGEKWAVEVFAGVASSENYKNDKTFGNTNDSKQSSTYGVKTKYKINKKWAVGSGLKINELGQSVANVSYLSAKNSSFLSSSDYFNQNPTASAAPITANDGYVFVPSTTANALKQNGIQSNNIESGNLDQSLRYIEMPLEVSYSIFNRNKASINLNTGGFVGKLISNNVAIDGNYIGQNVNANDYVYGSTLSSTLQYRVYKKTNIFVEPAMNYYINPLSNQSFNQFQWGLNFGLNVSF
ncbi:hypothetical protein [Flavobacterium chilense]|uniref:Outer membrane protein beta-barrel domain-containing protein n=1 Tax=Flavobacterium chilense TaxID=946677 RepID=A0A1M7G6Z6_9FLAO|nr:hypothetical protein [Flavobacterium chilense]SHM11697.1 hypothetical protein SAMN05444484_10467 [Flavobacterium chilense]